MKSLIKILFSLSLLVCLSTTSQAQYVTRTAVDTTANADTSYRTFYSTGDGITGIEAYVAKFSGSGTGYAVLEGRVDSLTGWTPISTDSLLILTATTGTYKKIWPINPQSANGYRIRYVTTGTQSSSIRAAYLRRSR